MQQQQRKISFVFLLLWLQFLVPASLLHSLCDHQDTEHPHFAYGQTISEQHHHCMVLELSLPNVLHSSDEWQLKTVQRGTPEFSAITISPCFTERMVAGIRGPPVIMI